jgi:hypothetical protein
VFVDPITKKRKTRKATAAEEPVRVGPEKELDGTTSQIGCPLALRLLAVDLMFS